MAPSSFLCLRPYNLLVVLALACLIPASSQAQRASHQVTVPEPISVPWEDFSRHSGRCDVSNVPTSSKRASAGHSSKASSPSASERGAQGTYNPPSQSTEPDAAALAAALASHMSGLWHSSRALLKVLARDVSRVTVDGVADVARKGQHMSYVAYEQTLELGGDWEGVARRARNGGREAREHVTELAQIAIVEASRLSVAVADGCADAVGNAGEWGALAEEELRVKGKHVLERLTKSSRRVKTRGISLWTKLWTESRRVYFSSVRAWREEVSPRAVLLWRAMSARTKLVWERSAVWWKGTVRPTVERVGRALVKGGRRVVRTSWVVLRSRLMPWMAATLRYTWSELHRMVLLARQYVCNDFIPSVVAICGTLIFGAYAQLRRAASTALEIWENRNELAVLALGVFERTLDVARSLVSWAVFVYRGLIGALLLYLGLYSWRVLGLLSMVLPRTGTFVDYFGQSLGSSLGSRGGKGSSNPPKQGHLVDSFSWLSTTTEELHDMSSDAMPSITDDGPNPGTDSCEMSTGPLPLDSSDPVVPVVVADSPRVQVEISSSVAVPPSTDERPSCGTPSEVTADGLQGLEGDEILLPPNPPARRIPVPRSETGLGEVPGHAGVRRFSVPSANAAPPPRLRMDDIRFRYIAGPPSSMESEGAEITTPGGITVSPERGPISTGAPGVGAGERGTEATRLAEGNVGRNRVHFEKEDAGSARDGPQPAKAPVENGARRRLRVPRKPSAIPRPTRRAARPLQPKDSNQSQANFINLVDDE